jgi:hypothetical protein
MESLPREALQALQLQRLQDTLRNAWDHVPWQPPAAAGRRHQRPARRGLRWTRCAACRSP